MLQSILKAMEGLREKLKGTEKFGLLYILDNVILEETVKVLELFHNATLTLSASKSPTLHLKVPVKLKLLSDLDAFSKDLNMSSDGRKVILFICSCVL